MSGSPTAESHLLPATQRLRRIRSTLQSLVVVAGAISALGITTALAFALDHSVWTQYFQVTAATRFDKLATPCLSISLRTILSSGTVWLQQYRPMMLGSIWGLSYLQKHHCDWDWSSNGSLFDAATEALLLGAGGLSLQHEFKATEV